MERYIANQIAAYYQLELKDVKRIKNVWKLTTSDGDFALKETTFQNREAERWFQMQRRLERLGYDKLVPILATIKGDYTVFIGDKQYYLMPWIEDEPYASKETKEEKIISEMGIIHRLTLEKTPLNQERFEQATKQLLKKWEMKRLYIEHFADEAERRIYPSPYELTFLMNTHYLVTLAEQAKQFVQTWHDACRESNTFRTVLCHGHLSRQHVHFNRTGKPYIFNLERASFDSPARDLALFCRSAFHYTLWDDEQMLRWFAIYNYHLPLYDEEMQLMLAYLCFPEPIYLSLQQYEQRERKGNELKQVTKLERRLFMLRKVERLKQYLLKKS